MDFRKLLTLKGISFWYLGAAIGLNLFWALSMTLLVSILFMKQVESGVTLVQLILIAASFIGPFLIGWMISAMAGDGRGPSYGAYGSLGGIVVLLVVALPTGILGLMLVFAAFAGGLNGGIFSLRGRFEKRSGRGSSTTQNDSGKGSK